MLKQLAVEANPLEVAQMSEFYWLNPFFGCHDPEPILREAFAWENNGIFVAMQSAATASSVELPWGTQDAETLDLAYFGNHSGGKFCSPVVKLLLQTESTVDEDGRLNSTGARKLADILLRKYLTNWNHLWATNVAAYEPIHNYDMTENRVLRTADSSSEHHQNVENDTTAHGRTNTEMDYKYGLNTDTNDPKPSDRIDSTDGGTTEVDTTRTNDRNRVGAGEEEESIHRAGNIGVTTTQKLIQEERDLWLWNFFDQVFNDLDKELALMFHDPCRV